MTDHLPWAKLHKSWLFGESSWRLQGIAKLMQPVVITLAGCDWDPGQEGPATLTSGGEPFTDAAISSITGIAIDDVGAAMAELERVGMIAKEGNLWTVPAYAKHQSKRGPRGSYKGPGKPKAQPGSAEAIDRLWAYQGELRASLPGTRELKLTGPRAKAVGAVLEHHSEGDCKAVLDHFHGEAVKSGSAEWFNGSTNWRLQNFERAQGRIGQGKGTAQTAAPDIRIGVAMPTADISDYRREA